ncbi:YeeE/YedE thiosulfate transporter family protein [Caballeronia novacaledonica]|uniref:Uncharacterized protein n=1 Tax=Caballeronia novacaledonica TaxID=1544861 RepID=A0AA37MT55_9BURK|nr:YeeE/YedE thiosulfate transporter family protein [Caballeronia novacaledonica]GJH26924.1 hypothetical protein CBA19CS42_20430 [Caballeronia novacaledonica]
MVFGIVSGVMIAAVGGGPMIGYGARRACGCIIGAYSSSIVLGSLDGWQRLVTRFCGNVIDMKLSTRMDSLSNA